VVDYGAEAPVPWDPAVEEALRDSPPPDRRLLPPRSNMMCFLRRQQAS